MKIYGICYLIQFPCDEEPLLEFIEIFESFAEAKNRTKRIMKKFFREYGEDDFGTEYPSENNPRAVMSNGEVTGYVFIKKIKNNLQSFGRKQNKGE